jgi:hypothetical protein
VTEDLEEVRADPERPRGQVNRLFPGSEGEVLASDQQVGGPSDSRHVRGDVSRLLLSGLIADPLGRGLLLRSVFGVLGHDGVWGMWYRGLRCEV